jgi:beta-mannosidase
VVAVNGRRVFLQGWNWVPLDHLYGTITPERYAWFIELARRAGANCLRVWGGGLIEPDVFYDLCDRAGILVWQEMPQSSSGLDNEPPSSPEFLARLRRTARAGLAGRRHHPSLFAWGGGNELTREGLVPLDASHPNLAAISEVMAAEAPHLVYLPTSPFGPSFDIKPENLGKGVHHDVHGPWKYQGTRAHYELFNTSDCLFHSEVGAEACAQVPSIHRFIPPASVWPPTRDNRQWLHHAHWWVQWDPVCELFGEQTDIERFVAASQLLQAEALRYAMEANRRRQGACGGTLIWQFGEPWPNATATSNVDYYGVPKLGFYAVAQAMRPRLATLAYERLCWAPGETFAARVFVHREARGEEAVSVRARLLAVDGAEIAARDWRLDAVPATVVPAGELRQRLPPATADVILVRLEACFGDRVARSTYAFSLTADLGPFMRLPQAHLAVAQAGGTLAVRNDGPVAAFLLSAGRSNADPVYFSGGGDVLLPGETQNYEVAVPGGRNDNHVTVQIGALNAKPATCNL